MIATKEQIVAEAERRREADLGEGGWSVVDYVIEVTREGWTPPEPVDPDLLAFREWLKGPFRVLPAMTDAYLAGARMAREQEQERAKFLVRFAKARAHLILDAAHALAAYKAGRADQ